MKTQELYRLATGKWYGILSHLIGKEFLNGRHGPCPICGGKDRFRWDDKDGQGGYYCSGCGPGYGMTLIMKARDLDYGSAAKEVEKLLGIVEVRAQRARQDPRLRLRRIAKESSFTTPGDPVGYYLSNRGLLTVPPKLRTHPKLAFFGDTGKVDALYPAMVALFSAPDGTGVTLQATYLKDGAKAPVDPCRKTLPAVQRFDGGAVRLWPLVNGALAIAEGVETACAAAESLRIPAWATLSDQNLAGFEPPEQVEKLFIIGDNDESYAGQAATFALAKKQRARRLSIELIIPNKTGTDFLDEYKEQTRGVHYTFG